MFKKTFFSLCFLAFGIVSAIASSAPISEQEALEVEKFFNSYIESANNYKDDLADKYTKDAEIERIVIKPNGTKESVIIPMERYLKELRKGRKTARLVKYKNTYTNKKYEKISDDKFKIKAKRTPMRDKESLDAEFVITKTPNGLKISFESMETKVQKFLNKK